MSVGNSTIRHISSANSGSSASSASNCNTQSHVALSMAEFFCAANPFQGSEKILAPYERAISSVLSVDPESTTMISPRPSRTSGITLSSVIGILASSFCVINTTEMVTAREYTERHAVGNDVTDTRTINNGNEGK